MGEAEDFRARAGLRGCVDRGLCRVDSNREGKMNSSWTVWCGGLLAGLAFAGLARGATEAEQAFQSRVFRNVEGQTLPYRILFPEGFRRDQRYPLVLFLHGAGERGDDNNAQLVHGMNTFAKAENRAKYPCFVVAPQCPKERKWVEVDWSADRHDMPKDPGPTMQLVLQMLASLQAEFPVDDKRLYVTGLSMGGYGTWDLAQRFPARFAAAAPICGGGDPVAAPAMVKAKLPIWAFHGDQDNAVKVVRSREMINALKQAGGMPKYTEYAGVGHNSWGPAYSDPELLVWLFSQKLP